MLGCGGVRARVLRRSTSAVLQECSERVRVRVRVLVQVQIITLRVLCGVGDCVECSVVEYRYIWSRGLRRGLRYKSIQSTTVGYGIL